MSTTNEFIKKIFKSKSNISIISLAIIVAVLLFVYLKDDGIGKIETKEGFSEGGGIFGIGGNANAPIRSVDYNTEYKKWSRAIQNDGPAKAYEDFKKEYAYDHFGVQHSAAHIFGEVLFDEEGLEGLTYCDTTFAFGCFHSFFGKAIYILGESVIPKMDASCVEKYGVYGTGCQHGIGHGILQYMGSDNLVDALNLCSLTTQKNPKFGCTSGVFMEHNVPLVDFGEGSYVTKIRDFNSEDPYEPCPKLPYEFRESCYYELGQWWEKTFNRDYKAMGLACKNIPDKEFERSCYLGIGNVVPPGNNYDLSKSIEACSLMPNDDGRLVCFSGSSWSFFANPDYRDIAPKVCDIFDNKETKEKCLRGADLIGGSQDE